MRVNDLDESQRKALDTMTLEIMVMATMWAIQPDTREALLAASRRPDAKMRSAFDLIVEVLDGWHEDTADVRPSVYDDFLVTLE